MNKKNESLFNSLFKNRINKSPIDNKLFKNKKKKFGTDIKFKKVINSLILNIGGEKPLIIYKKSPTKNRKVEIRHNNYMTDGGIAKKTKKFFNIITKYCFKKEAKNIIQKEKDDTIIKKNKKYKSFSLSNKKIDKKKNNYFEENNDRAKNIQNKNKSKCQTKCNLFLKSKNYSSEKKEISSYNNPYNILKAKTKKEELFNKNYL